MVKIGVILGSTRTKALGEKIFKYLKSNIQVRDVEFNWLDLKDYPLPLYDHPQTPLEDEITDLNSAEASWLNDLDQQDGYVILTPEYDRAITGVLKNALDFVGPQVNRKPVHVVAYSHFSDGGIVAAASIVPILQMLNMIVLPSPALLWDADKNFATDGKLITGAENSDHFEQRLKSVFDEIGFYTQVLAENPYQG
ncbi:NADPH-dependent FMN reductase [Companilactobacillus versmoldensis]|uniref:Flavoprotein n=1 Tax=Companilactobacillus versmoldensis DSM 14857 = KCTC 3814 TaxID=1423815 RepID=A0A0R1SJ91_9LACO|nr:NAD(P)H-dependent oxidoreductase [Companilactobacillus versmoldensis]KRL66357.1 flavoprotein [Companilactobacillus versmoldensis DSM 14857 = KCTC 3814]